MKTRVISGAVFVVVLAVAFFLAPSAVAAVALALMVALASYELLYATGLVKNIRLNVYSAVMSVAIVLWSHLGGPFGAILLGVLLYVMLLCSQLLLSSGKQPVAEIAYCLLSGLVVPFFLTSLLRIRNGESGQILLLVPFILAYFSDTGAYFIGVTMGKHKMCPNISPKKSWEGFVGGVLMAIIGMVLFAVVLDKVCHYQVRYWLAALYGLVGSLASVLGDLTMSVIKRQCGIKDYGKLIPGHGGILDRFDSVMLTAPLSEAFLLLIPFVV